MTAPIMVTNARSWIAAREPAAETQLRLICFPYAGGGASTYRGWTGALPSAIEVCAVQLPGRENRLRDPPYVRLGPLVEKLVQVLQAYMDKPVAFFGHSMGALISFELARQLRRQKQPGPVQLFVSGFRAPHLPDPNPPIHDLPDSIFIQELRRLNGTPEEVLQNTELRQLMLPLLRADFAMCETYAYSPEDPLSCPIVAFGGEQDADVACEQVSAWGKHTSKTFQIRLLPGDHFFIHTTRSLLLQTLSGDLERLLYQATEQLDDRR